MGEEGADTIPTPHRQTKPYGNRRESKNKGSALTSACLYPVTPIFQLWPKVSQPRSYKKHRQAGH
jgi:hypothetical protein